MSENDKRPPAGLTSSELEAMKTFLTGLHDRKVAEFLDRAAQDTRGFTPVQTLQDVMTIKAKCKLRRKVVSNAEEVVRQLPEPCQRLARLCVKPEGDDSDDVRRRLVPNRFMLERAFAKLRGTSSGPRTAG